MVVVIWVICAVVCAVIAGSKKRNGAGWFFIGLIIGIFGVILVAVLPSLEPPAQPVAHHVLPPPSPKLGTLGRASPPDAIQSLEKLAVLHQQGVLTDEEFGAKKQELLDRV